MKDSIYYKYYGHVYFTRVHFDRVFIHHVLRWSAPVKSKYY